MKNFEFRADATADRFANVSGVLRPGVYVLRWRGEVVYVGAAARPLTRLYTHAAKRGPHYLRKQMFRFDEAHVCPCAAEDLGRLERELIEHYRPRHNVRGVRPPKTTPPIVLRIGTTTLRTDGPRAPRAPFAFERRV